MIEWTQEKVEELVRKMGFEVIEENGIKYVKIPNEHKLRETARSIGLDYDEVKGVIIQERRARKWRDN